MTGQTCDIYRKYVKIKREKMCCHHIEFSTHASSQKAKWVNISKNSNSKTWWYYYDTSTTTIHKLWWDETGGFKIPFWLLSASPSKRSSAWLSPSVIQIFCNFIMVHSAVIWSIKFTLFYILLFSESCLPYFAVFQFTSSIPAGVLG